MQILSRESPSATRKGGHHYPQCRLPSFASLIAAIGTGGYSEVSLRLKIVHILSMVLSLSTHQ